MEVSEHMTDWNEMAQAGKEAIEENRYSFDFEVVTTGDVAEVERRVKQRWGKKASVTSAGNTVLISIEDSRGWSRHDEELMSDMHRSGIIGLWQRFLGKK